MSSGPTRAELEGFVRYVLRAPASREPAPEEVEAWIGRLEKGLSPFAMVAELSRGRSRRNFVEAAPLAFPPGHFYSPVTDPALVEAHLARVRPGRPTPGLRIDPDAMTELWRSFAPWLDPKPFPDEKQAGRRYWFQNPAFGPGDGAVLHCMLRKFQPRRIVEVGSGYSSLCTLETAERFLPETTTLTFIEPRPELLNDLLAEAEPKREVEILPIPVQEAPLSVFEALEANDVLFIDSTHVLKTGSDVVFELFEVLPRLKSGVLVHFHDIGWPFEYTRRWAVDQNRSWNEAYGLRAFLTFNRSFDIVFFNDYFRRVRREEVERVAPWVLSNAGASIWLQRR